MDFSSSIRQIESMISKIESTDDVDDILSMVKGASSLLKDCDDKIESTLKECLSVLEGEGGTSAL